MKTITFITTALVATTGIHALPQFTPIAANKATCNVDITQGTAAGIYYQTYDVHVGLPFNGGSGCNTIHDRIASVATGALEKWLCVDNGVGQTQLGFRTGGAGFSAANEAIVDALQGVYPTVPFVGEGICLL